MLLLAASLAGWGQAGAGQPVERLAFLPRRGAYRLHYTLDLTHPANHLIAVRLDVGGFAGRLLRVRLPVWYPGRYSVYNFAANLQNFQAICRAGARPPLPVLRTGPSSWSVRTLGCPVPRIQYRIYANTLTGSFAQLDRTHANINGGPVFVYLPGHKPDPVALTVLAPSGWQVLDEIGRLNQIRLRFPNYDIFIDSPLEAAPQIQLHRFRDSGRLYRVMIHAYGPDGGNAPRLVEALKKIVHVENRVFGPPAGLRTYTFFFHFDAASPGDGMEHLFGTQIIIPATLASRGGLLAAEADAAHEFFHQWNVKRLRPAALGPFRYSRPDPTRCLWIAEGLTQYYGEITLERAGLLSAPAYLRQLAANISNFKTQPGRHLMSAADSSLTAWFHDRTPLWQETNQRATTISYYQKGDLLGVLLDLDIRRRTGGRRSLDDALRYLWNHVYKGPRASYYLPGRGYRQRDLRRALKAVDGRSYRRFFAHYAAGTQALPYNRCFSAIGMQLDCKPAPGRNNYLGLALAGNRVLMVAPRSPAASAGFGVDDVIVSIHGQPVNSDEVLSALGALPAGRKTWLQVQSHGQVYTLTLLPSPPRADSCSLVDSPGATAAERQIRRQWLEGRDRK